MKANQLFEPDAYMVEGLLFDRDTKVLTVSRDAIRSTDSTLRVEITSDCRPVVR